MVSNTETIEAGALIRRSIRRWLMERDIKFQEEKGWLDSVFYVNLTNPQRIELRKVINYLNK